MAAWSDILSKIVSYQDDIGACNANPADERKSTLSNYDLEEKIYQVEGT